MFAGLEHALSLSKPARPCSVLVVYPGCRPVESIQSCTGSWPAAGTVTNFDQEQRQEGRGRTVFLPASLARHRKFGLDARGRGRGMVFPARTLGRSSLEKTDRGGDAATTHN